MRQTLGNVWVLLRDARGTAVFAICFPSLTSDTHFFREYFTIWFASTLLDAMGGWWEAWKQCFRFYRLMFPQKSDIHRWETELGLILTPDNKLTATAWLTRLKIKRTDLLFEFLHHLSSVPRSELHWLVMNLLITRSRWHLFPGRARQWLLHSGITSIWLLIKPGTEFQTSDGQ